MDRLSVLGALLVGVVGPGGTVKVYRGAEWMYGWRMEGSDEWGCGANRE